MKFYKKSKLAYKYGYLVTKKGKVVPVDNDVVNEANKIERMLQKVTHDRAAERIKKLTAKTLEALDSEFVSEREMALPVTTNTPTLDESVERSRKLMDEIDLANSANDANRYLAEDVAELVQWVSGEQFVGTVQCCQQQFDVPLLTEKYGNPLKWTKETVTEMVTELFVDFDLVDAETKTKGDEQ